MENCNCGRVATVEINFPNLDNFYGRDETWNPSCDECTQEALENAEDHNSFSVNIESGGPVIVNLRSN